MGKPEAHVEKYLVALVKKQRGMCLKFTSAVSGVPDRIIILAGRTVFVEAKAPGEKPTPLQLVQIGRMRRAGADVRIIDTREQVDALVAELLAPPVETTEERAA